MLLELQSDDARYSVTNESNTYTIDGNAEDVVPVGTDDTVQTMYCIVEL